MKKFDVLYICTDNNATSLRGLEALHQKGYSTLVVAYELPALRYDPKQPEELYQKPYGFRKKRLREESVGLYCHKHRTPYLLTHETNLDILLPVFRSMQFDYVVVNEWSAKLSMDIASLASIAAMNCHPAFLPEYRGGNITYAPLINRENSSGITIHILTEVFDAGDILAQQRFDITASETTASLRLKRSRHIGGVLLEALKIAGHPEKYIPNPVGPFWKKQSLISFRLYQLINLIRPALGLKPLKKKPDPSRWIDRL